MDCSYFSNCGVVPFLLHVLLYCYVVIQISSSAFPLLSYVGHALLDYIKIYSYCLLNFNLLFVSSNKVSVMLVINLKLYFSGKIHCFFME